MWGRSCQAFLKIVSSPGIHPTLLSLSSDTLLNVQATLVQRRGEGRPRSPWAIFTPHLRIPDLRRVLGTGALQPLIVDTLPTSLLPLGIQLGPSQSEPSRNSRGAGLPC